MSNIVSYITSCITAESFNSNTFDTYCHCYALLFRSNYKIFGIAILVVVPVLSAFLIYVVSVEHPILIEDYQRKRIVDFIEGKSEEVDMNDAGTYQQAYAVQAIGSGQLYGKGLNNNDTSSLKNAGYIAEAQNDLYLQ